MLQKGDMEDGPGKYYEVMVDQKPYGTINQVGKVLTNSRTSAFTFDKSNGCNFCHDCRMG
jgi:hypothetical protein